VLAGRGFGKTRSGAECIRDQVIHHGRLDRLIPYAKNEARCAASGALNSCVRFELNQT
jgi:hypothetical protein